MERMVLLVSFVLKILVGKLFLIMRGIGEGSVILPMN